MNAFTKIVLIYIAFSITIFGALHLEADNINDPHYKQRVNFIKDNISSDEISGFSFVYGVDAQQCFNILTDSNLVSSQYSDCKSFVDDLHSEILSDL